MFVEPGVTIGNKIEDASPVLSVVRKTAKPRSGRQQPHLAKGIYPLPKYTHIMNNLWVKLLFYLWKIRLCLLGSIPTRGVIFRRFDYR